MDTSTLVTEQLDAGGRLLQQLAQEGFPVTVAFWMNATENGKWYFYIVSSLVDDVGLTSAYGRLNAVIRQMPEPCEINFFRHKLIGPSDPMAQDAIAVYRALPGLRTRPLRWGWMLLGRTSVEELYFYPLPAGVAV